MSQDALSKLDFFVMQEIFFSETCRFADVILPACPSLEKEGTFTSTERRIQRLYQVFEPLGESRPDWQIIQDIANRLGAGWKYEHPSQIYEEIAPLTPLMAGVTYERLEGYKSLQWPVAEDGSDQPLLYTKQFNFPDGKATFFPVPWSEPTDQQDAEYDLHLNNGRLLEHFHEGNMTYRTEGIREKTPCTFVEVSPELASGPGNPDGKLGATHLALRQGARAGGDHDASSGQGAVHAHELDRRAGQPADQQPYRQGNAHAGVQGDIRCSCTCWARLAKIRCRRTNSRHGHPTPQSGCRSGTQVEARGLSPTWLRLVQIQTR